MPQISDEALAKLDALHAVIRDNSRTDYHDAMDKFSTAVAVVWESISARCKSSASETQPSMDKSATRASIIEECAKQCEIEQDYGGVKIQRLSWQCAAAIRALADSGAE